MFQMRRYLCAVASVILSSVIAACSGGATASNSASLSPVGHRWVVQNESGLLCYDSADDLETARGMDSTFEDITPSGFHYSGDESAGGRLTQGDIISIDSAGNDYYVVTPIRAAVVNEGKPCEVDIETLHLSSHNADAKHIANWQVGTVYKGTNEITPCFLTPALAAEQYDAEVASQGTGNGDKSLHVSDDPDDPGRYRLQRIETKVLTFAVLKGGQDTTINGYTMRSPHTGETIYCAHENGPQ